MPVKKQRLGRHKRGHQQGHGLSLPESMPAFCRGCWNCFTDFKKCPDYGYLKPVIESMLKADLLIFTAPVYVFRIPGQLRAFFDHFGYQWMAHQPRREMFGKQALLISTAAGAGTKSALKDLKDSMAFGESPGSIRSAGTSMQAIGILWATKRN